MREKIVTLYLIPTRVEPTYSDLVLYGGDLFYVDNDLMLCNKHQMFSHIPLSDCTTVWPYGVSDDKIYPNDWVIHQMREQLQLGDTDEFAGIKDDLGSVRFSDCKLMVMEPTEFNYQNIIDLELNHGDNITVLWGEGGNRQFAVMNTHGTAVIARPTSPLDMIPLEEVSEEKYHDLDWNGSDITFLYRHSSYTKEKGNAVSLGKAFEACNRARVEVMEHLTTPTVERSVLVERIAKELGHFYGTNGRRENFLAAEEILNILSEPGLLKLK